MFSYDATTEAVTVSVRPAYLDDQSDVLAGRFVFAYVVRIENGGADEVQLLRRRWVITDGRGHVQEVEGAGVVGQQPTIAPGGDHEYQSFCVLPTFEGTMHGSYLMQRENGARFHAQIPRFHLRALAN
ncbi:Co2+/Mg2+ efflux protein ApaG [Rubrivirga litoralis]|uniref:Co2+/Mg2+ efflux protein ApaG n=1 Tax=Rubrivirga litoralis TaxID=3075598 RepID=A0ABU3BP47_9BACT|nr:Co2+/Mg2+ efflux protein ApaG [Rubrivirga sp. F394]MDT0630981.1 Co2+/Mg2+ efflux protein ApaG [Rubrivirga sp. F394]